MFILLSFLELSYILYLIAIANLGEIRLRKADAAAILGLLLLNSFRVDSLKLEALSFLRVCPLIFLLKLFDHCLPEYKPYRLASGMESVPLC